MVDCVGLSDEDYAFKGSAPLDRDPSIPLKSLLQDVATGITDDARLTTLAARLKRLENKLSPESRDEFQALAGNQRLKDIAEDLVHATKPTAQEAEARLQGAGEEPSEDELREARERLVRAGVAPLMKPEVRRKIEALQSETEQVIDLTSRDQVLFAGFVDVGEARSAVESFEEFIAERHDEFVALKAYFAPPYHERLSYDDVKALAKAIEKPPYSLTPAKLWAAYEKLDADKVRGSGGKLLTDIVSLVRYALKRDEELIPHEDVVRLRFDLWLTEQRSAGREFSGEQMRWLGMVRDHMAASLTIEPDDFDLEPFVEEGGLNAAAEVFGANELRPLLEELNERLAAA